MHFLPAKPNPKEDSTFAYGWIKFSSNHLASTAVGYGPGALWWAICSQLFFTEHLFMALSALSTTDGDDSLGTCVSLCQAIRESADKWQVLRTKKKRMF